MAEYQSTSYFWLIRFSRTWSWPTALVEEKKRFRGEAKGFFFAVRNRRVRFRTGVGREETLRLSPEPPLLFSWL